MIRSDPYDLGKEPVTVRFGEEFRADGGGREQTSLAGERWQTHGRRLKRAAEELSSK